MGKDTQGVMNVRLIEEFIEMNAVVKPSRREFKSWSENIYIGIIVLFISLLVLYYYFYCSRFILFIYLSFGWYAFFFFFFFFCFLFFLFVIVFVFKLFAIYVLNILEYMNRQQQPSKIALICCRDAQADLGHRFPQMQKEPFSHDMALS